MPKLAHEFVSSENGGACAMIVKKSRSKINIAELTDYLLYDARKYGHWVVIINANESCCEVGWPTEESKGDSVLLYEAEAEGVCPVCAKLLPPEYCPHCGEKIMEGSKNG